MCAYKSAAVSAHGTLSTVGHRSLAWRFLRIHPTKNPQLNQVIRLRYLEMPGSCMWHGSDGDHLRSLKRAVRHGTLSGKINRHEKHLGYSCSLFLFLKDLRQWFHMFEHHFGMFAKSGRMPAKSSEKPLRLSRPHTCRIFEILLEPHLKNHSGGQG